jgi:hypothetical protein
VKTHITLPCKTNIQALYTAAIMPGIENAMEIE